MGLASSLRSGKIHEVELRNLESGVGGMLLEVYSENGVGARTELVELGGSDVAELVSLLHDGHDFLKRVNLCLSELVDVDAVADALSDVQVLVRGIDQIVYVFVVNFKVADTDVEVVSVEALVLLD